MSHSTSLTYKGITPLFNRLLVELDEIQYKTPSGIILTDASALSQGTARAGTVRAFGPDTTLKGGQRVLLTKFPGTQVRVDGKTFEVVNEPDILCKTT